MFNSIFASYNEEVRKAHIEKYGLDINKMTPEQKENHFRKNKVFITNLEKC